MGGGFGNGDVPLISSRCSLIVVCYTRLLDPRVCGVGIAMYGESSREGRRSEWLLNSCFGWHGSTYGREV